MPPSNQGGKAGLSVPTVSTPGSTSVSWSCAQFPAAAAVVVVPDASSSSPPQPDATRASTRIGRTASLFTRATLPLSVMGEFVELEVGERVVKVTNPDKVYYSARGETKLDHVRYYLSVGEGIVRALYERPTQLKRHPGGAESKAIYQKRVPESRPEWIEVARVTFPSGRHADELCITELAQVAWAANLGTIDFHPWPSRRAHVDNPDELRIDVDPQPGTDFGDAKTVAGVVHEVLDEIGYVGWPKTSGNRGIHVACRIEPNWEFPEVRRCALAFARESSDGSRSSSRRPGGRRTRRARVHRLHQNARDRTIASAYSVRARPDGRSPRR